MTRSFPLPARLEGVKPRRLVIAMFVVSSGDANASNPLEVLANVALFVPFGAYLGVLGRWRWFVIASVLVASSVVLEAVQHVLSVGSFDTTDVIANTSGGLLGLLLARLLSTTMMTRVLVIGTLLALVAAAAFTASPLQYHAPRDVVLR
jgi:glycopeptide antibiotics resistance protein